jgi:predicted Zn-dependent peptidase
MNRWIASLALASVAAACAPAAPPAAAPPPPAAPAAARPGPDYPTTAPALGPAPSLRLPTPVRRTLANGMTVIYVPKRDLPVVQATLLTRGGLSDDPAQQPGLAAFAAAMLDEGAGGRSSLQLAEAIEQLGATLSTGAGWDAAQSEIRIGHPGVARDTPDFYALTVMNTLLGGSFTSRLMQNLRETHGYTYGAGSSFQMRRGAGPFMATSAVVTAKTDSAVIEFFRELNRIRDEAVPADELERAKNFVALRLPQNFETTGQIAVRIAELVMYDLPLDYYETYVQRIMAVTAADVQRVAREYVRPDRSAIVVVGDRQTIEAGLRALPVGEVEVRRIEEFVR